MNPIEKILAGHYYKVIYVCNLLFRLKKVLEKKKDAIVLEEKEKIQKLRELSEHGIKIED